MSALEEAIYPTLFRSSYHKASASIAHTACWLLERQERLVMSRYGITWTQFCVLSVLRERFPYAMPGMKIKSRLPYMPSSPLSENKKLVTQKLVEYNSSAPKKEDRGFRISKEGLELLTRIDNRVSQVDKLVGNISFGEAEELSRLLDKIRN